FDWLPKFRSQMEDILRTELQDRKLGEGYNDIVMFKSCYPNSEFVGMGSAPGSSTGPELTVWNAKAMMNALRDELPKHPEVLFIYVTAPPLAPVLPKQPVWKWAAKKMLGRGMDQTRLEARGTLARNFNDWVKSPDGWLKDYPHKNVVVFDYYNVLT